MEHLRIHLSPSVTRRLNLFLPLPVHRTRRSTLEELKLHHRHSRSVLHRVELPLPHLLLELPWEVRLPQEDSLSVLRLDPVQRLLQAEDCSTSEVEEKMQQANQVDRSDL